jgi:NMD protein affecting ribosome stability and mRNA decay
LSINNLHQKPFLKCLFIITFISTIQTPSGMKSKDERRAKPNLHDSHIQLLSGYEPVSLQYCPDTNLIFTQSRWKKADPAHILEKQIIKAVKIQRGILDPHIEVELPDDLNDGKAIVHVSAEVNDQLINQSYDIEYHLQPQTSPIAAKATSQYFEGVIHIRNVTESFRPFIKQTLEHAREKGMFVTKETHGDNWMDLQITDQRIARTVGQKLQEQFGGELKVDAKHFSEDKQSGKIIYRSDITMIFFPFTKYALITKADETYVVSQLTKKATLENINKSEKIKITADEASSYDVIKPTTIQITQQKPQLKGIHPQTYQEEIIIHKEYDCEPRTYVIDEQLYLIGAKQ